MATQIEDYALVGDCETAALVARDGGIDWLCWPAFDSEACFAALLGDGSNGRWKLAPVDEPRAVTRRYLRDTLVLETRFETPDGVVTVTDFMPIRGENSDLIRIARCERGRVRMRSTLGLRFDYGRIPPWMTRDDHSVTAVAGPNGVRIHCEAELKVDDGDCTADFTLRENEECAFTLSYFRSHEPPPKPVDPRHALQATIRYWRKWVGDCRYEGPWGEAVIRSLIVLKALTYRPTGGLVAAATSSLPESPGGSRNWDYRFCWLRDATFTLMSLLQAGYKQEAAAWRDWLLRAAAGAPANLQPVYSISGRHRLMEWEAGWLSGFGGARPVRFGNAASDQRQLDVYGEVVDALYQAERHGVEMSRSEWALQRAVVDHVAQTWREPDRGIWEVRGSLQRFTHSQVMAWVAVDRGIKTAERRNLEVPLDDWRRLRAEMHEEICKHAFDEAQNSFTQAFDSKVLDAACLLIPQVGFLPVTDPRVVGTVEAIRGKLMNDGFVQRYDTGETDDGVSGGEGAFLACSFWLADNLVMQDRRDAASEIFERLLSIRNDVGLLSEEYLPHERRLAGNFPQALSHLSLVNTAFNLSGRGPAQERGEER